MTRSPWVLVMSVGTLVVTLSVAGCSTDPEVAKRRYLASGDQYLAAKQYPEAIIEYRNAVTADPRSGDARRKLGEAYLASGDPGNGLRELVRAADLLPLDDEVQLTAGGMRLFARQFEDAQAAADKVLARNPTNVRALVLRANAIAGLKNVDEAVEEIQEAISLDPSSAELYTNLGGLELQRKRLNEAETALKKAISIQPNSAVAHLALGNFYWAIGRRTEAEQAFKSAIAADASNVVAQKALATWYLSTGRKAEAEAPLRVLAQLPGDGTARLNLADFYLLADNTAEAVRLLKELEQDPKSSGLANERLAAIAYGAGRRDEAHRRVDQLLQANRHNAAALVLKARFLFLEGKLGEALERARAATLADSRSVAAFFTLGLVAAAQRDIDEATKAFSEVLRLNPRSGVAQYHLSRLRLAAGDTPAALKFAEEAVKIDPRAFDSRVALARSLLATGEMDRAQAEIVQLGQTRPDSPDFNVLRGQMLLAQKRFSEAGQAFSHAYGVSRNRLDALSGLIAVDLAAGKPQEARSRIDAHLARTATPSSADRILAAKTYGATRDLPKAEETLRAVIDADPANLQAYGMLGQLYYSRGQLANGRRAFEGLAVRDPKSVGAQTMLGIISSREGHADQAKARYEQALAIDPRAAVAANNLAWMYAEKGENLDMALDLAQVAFAEMPEDAAVRDTLGWVFCRKGLWPQAIPLFEQNVKADPGNPGHHYRLGIAHHGAGHVSAARDALERALKLGADAAQAKEAERILKELSQRSGV